MPRTKKTVEIIHKEQTSHPSILEEITTEAIQETQPPTLSEDEIKLLELLKETDRGGAVSGGKFYEYFNLVFKTTKKYTDCSPCNVDNLKFAAKHFKDNYGETFKKI